jgi:hypothetical protein
MDKVQKPIDSESIVIVRFQPENESQDFSENERGILTARHLGSDFN